MKKCGYCGKTLDDNDSVCTGCGTPFILSEHTTVGFFGSIHSKVRSGRLDGWSASAIFLAAQLAQIALGILLASLATLLGFYSRSVTPVRGLWSAGIVLLAPIIEAVVVFSLSFGLVPAALADRTDCGAAWARSGWRPVGQAILLGLLLGFIITFLGRQMALVSSTSRHTAMGFDSVRAHFAAIAAVAAVFLAPIPEELLFRGILYGGYRRSFGHFRAAVVSTSLFVAVHLPGMGYAAAITTLGLVGLSLTALWCRLRWETVWPAVAAHVGYNISLTIVRFL